MNYDLCDLLNRKLEALFNYMPVNLNAKSTFKDQKFFTNLLEKKYPEDYLEYLDNEFQNSETFTFWVYRNGKFSNMVSDFDSSAKLVLREISNLTFSNNPCYDIMYFSGIMKMYFDPTKGIYLETCSKPSLDQLISLKDFEKNKNIKNIYWRIIDKKNKSKSYDGKSLDDLFKFNWSRIK